MNSDAETSAIARAASEIRAWGAVAIIGAGASLSAGMPLIAQMQALIWHALDADDHLCTALAGKHGWAPGTAKEIIGDDPVRTRLAQEALAMSQTARRAFQYGFQLLNAERSSSAPLAHDVLAELLHRRVIQTVISLNWDTLLETAYQNRYGVGLRADGQWLWKPHGDAAVPEIDWVLPHETGRIPDRAIGHIRSLVADHPRVLLIVGYSERDEEVINQVIRPLSTQWRVIRVGPNVLGELDIRLPAELALPRLRELICPDREVTGWDYVRFDNQHDLGPALAGYKLGPKDVIACPRLPEIALVAQLLKVAKSAQIVGDSGSGKSITAYQVAYDFHQEGWEVLHLIEPQESTDLILAGTSSLPRPSLLIVDDAQDLNRRLITRLIEGATEDLLVLILTSDPSASRHDSIRLGSRAAVATIAEAFRRRQRELLPLVKVLDSHVGDGYLDESLDDRLSQAAASGTAWQFGFVLRGGWRKARQQIASLRDQDRSDLLLVAIALRQLVMLDNASSMMWLHTATRVLEKDVAWLNRSLDHLCQQRIILGRESARCPHARYAEVVLRVAYGDMRDPFFSRLMSLLCEALLHEQPPLRGIAWVLGEVRFAEGLCLGRGGAGLVGDTWQHITERCWAASSGSERSHAAFVLNELIHWHSEHVEALTAHTSQLGHWLDEIDAEAAYGFGRLLNDLSQGHRALTEAICQSARPAAIAATFARSALSEAYAWGWLIGRLSVAAPKQWCQELRDSIDTRELRSMVTAGDFPHLHGLSELSMGISGLSPELGCQLLDWAHSWVVVQLNASPIRGFTAIQEALWFVLGYAPRFLRPPKAPTAMQRRIARRLGSALDIDGMAAAISRSQRRDWQVCEELVIFLREAIPQRATAIARKVDFTQLDDAANGLWGDPPHELVALVHAFGIDQENEPARSWISRHASELVRLSLVFAAISPETIARRMREGYALDLGVSKGADWTLIAYAMYELANADRDLAIQLLEDHRAEISQRLALQEDSLCKGVPIFLKVAQDLDLDLLHAIISEIDIQKARDSWAKQLRGKTAERKAVIALLGVAAEMEGPVGELATELKAKSHRSH